jgi:2-haloacid dehalogenase
MNQPNPSPRVLLFDVNETLLDLAALNPVFIKAFGDPYSRQDWFDASIRTVLLDLALGRSHGFAEIGQAALATVAASRGVPLTDLTRRAVRDGMKSLPPHLDVLPALERLRAAGFVLAALSNNPIETLTAQFEAAALRPLFAQVFAASWSGRLKPHPSAYAMAAEGLAVPLAEILFVAAHGWDVAGAANAGFRTAFVARPGQALEPLAPAPDLVVPDLGALADIVIGPVPNDERAGV